MTRTSKRSKERGAALLITVFFFIFISIAVILSSTTAVISELRTYRTLATSKFAYVAAEAGIEDMFLRAINGSSTVSTTIVLNGATSTVEVINVSATEKEFYATGEASGQVRKLYMRTSRNVSVSLPYGAQVGEGGMSIKNTAYIIGDVYSDGEISGANNNVTGSVVSSSGISTDPTASSTVYVSSEDVGKSATPNNIDYAQSFVIGTTTTVELTKVSLYIKRTNPAGPAATIRIVEDDGTGKPKTTALSSQALPSVSTSYGWVDINFTTPADLAPSTIYWIVFDATADNRYWYWGRSNSDVYSGGTAHFKTNWTTGGAWSAALAGDMMFKFSYGNGESQIEDINVSGTAKADIIEDVDVTGDAYYQTLIGGSVGGTTNPGSPTPPYVPLPISSTTIAQWKAEATAGGTITGDCVVGEAGDCLGPLPLELGPKLITGDLIVDGGAGQDATKRLLVTGTLYVEGDILIDNKGKIQCHADYGVKSCVIIADGYIEMKPNGELSGSGTLAPVKSFLMLLSTKENARGPGGPGCIGANTCAIAIQNNVDGALFYTTDSLIDISNGVDITAVVGYMLEIQNGASITYDTDLADLIFAPSTAPTTGAWHANRWNEY